MKRFLFPAWVGTALILFLYSYTQVSLSLTLTRASFFQEIQKTFQYVGFFNRPLSTGLFLFIILLLCFLYFATLWAISGRLLSKKQVTKIIVAVSGILLFSYSAFSFDIFNYMFDAKIITYYQQNPYLHKALDFPSDPMLSFMHWTHRTYPYGPIWLGLTIPFSFLGMQKFIVTFFLFKLLAVVSYLGSTVLIYKIVQKKSNEHALFAAAFFALNPLILIEFLVSAHNDIVMIFFALLGIYLLIQKRVVGSFLSMVLSVGTKFATAFILPMGATILFFKNGSGNIM